MNIAIPFNDLTRIHTPIKKKVIKEFEQVVDKSQFVLNSDIKNFEQKFSEYTNAKYTISCANGTDAIELILRALDIKFGDEVIIPANTFIATALAVSRTGAVPIFVDNDENYLIDTEKIEAFVNKRTKAIIGVHLYGQQANNLEISKIAKKYNLYYLEDSAQAHGSLQKTSPPGKFGIAAAYSFYPGKNLGAWGDGGAITTNNKRVANKLIQLRNWGSSKKYVHDSIGYNSRLQPIQGIVLREKLKYLDEWTKDRNYIAEQYLNAFSSNKNLIVPKVVDINYHAWHLFVIRVKNRNKVMKELLDAGIQTVIHYPIPIQNQKAYQNHPQYNAHFPNANKFSKNLLSLPLFPKMKNNEINYVVQNVNKALN